MLAGPSSAHQAPVKWLQERLFNRIPDLIRQRFSCSDIKGLFDREQGEKRGWFVSDGGIMELDNPRQPIVFLLEVALSQTDEDLEWKVKEMRDSYNYTLAILLIFIREEAIPQTKKLPPYTANHHHTAEEMWEKMCEEWMGNRDKHSWEPYVYGQATVLNKVNVSFSLFLPDGDGYTRIVRTHRLHRLNATHYGYQNAEAHAPSEGHGGYMAPLKLTQPGSSEPSPLLPALHNYLCERMKIKDELQDTDGFFSGFWCHLAEGLYETARDRLGKWCGVAPEGGNPMQKRRYKVVVNNDYKVQKRRL